MAVVTNGTLAIAIVAGASQHFTANAIALAVDRALAAAGPDATVSVSTIAVAGGWVRRRWRFGGECLRRFSFLEFDGATGGAFEVVGALMERRHQTIFLVGVRLVRADCLFIENGRIFVLLFSIQIIVAKCIPPFAGHAVAAIQQAGNGRRCWILNDSTVSRRRWCAGLAL